MAEGAKFFNDDSSLYMDLTTYCGAFLGSFTTGGTAGSITVAALIGRRLLSFCPTATSTQGQGFGGPVVTLNSSTGQISWTYPGTAQTGGQNDTVFYGGY